MLREGRKEEHGRKTDHAAPLAVIKRDCSTANKLCAPPSTRVIRDSPLAITKGRGNVSLTTRPTTKPLPCNHSLVALQHPLPGFRLAQQQPSETQSLKATATARRILAAY